MTGYFGNGGQAAGVRRSEGWSLVAAMWDTRTKRLLGCLGTEGSADGSSEIVIDLEETPAAA